MKQIRTHYDNLKVARNATQEEIKNAYRRLAKQYHPDKNSNPEAKRIMKIINIAYTELSDAARRAEHDHWIINQEQSSQNEKQRYSQESYGEHSNHKPYDTQNYYEIFELPSDANQILIRSKYYELLELSLLIKDDQQRLRKMNELSTIYSILGVPESRQKYDEQLRQPINTPTNNTAIIIVIVLLIVLILWIYTRR